MPDIFSARQVNSVTKETPSMTPIRASKSSLPLQVAIAIVGVWIARMWICFQVRLETLNPVGAICLLGWQTWIYTGLFITAHDAMHGSIHRSRSLNRAIGQVCLWLYAGFDYCQLSIVTYTISILLASAIPIFMMAPQRTSGAGIGILSGI